MQDSSNSNLAVKIEISSHTRDYLLLDIQTALVKYVFDKVDWIKFKIHLIENNDIDISNDINLTIDEIDSYIIKLNKHINNTLDYVVPRINNNISLI